MCGNRKSAWTITVENTVLSDGGGGNSTAMLNGVTNSVFRRNHYRMRPGVTINTQAGLIDKCGKGNVFEDNRINGKVNPQGSVCP